MPLCALCDDTEGPEKQLQVLLPCGRAGGSAERVARARGVACWASRRAARYSPRQRGVAACLGYKLGEARKQNQMQIEHVAYVRCHTIDLKEPPPPT